MIHYLMTGLTVWAERWGSSCSCRASFPTRVLPARLLSGQRDPLRRCQCHCHIQAAASGVTSGLLSGLSRSLPFLKPPLRALDTGIFAQILLLSLGFLLPEKLLSAPLRESGSSSCPKLIIDFGSRRNSLLISWLPSLVGSLLLSPNPCLFTLTKASLASATSPSNLPTLLFLFGQAYSLAWCWRAFYPSEKFGFSTSAICIKETDPYRVTLLGETHSDWPKTTQKLIPSP